MVYFKHAWLRPVIHMSFTAWNEQLLFYIEKKELAFLCYFRFPCCSNRSIGNSTEEANRIETSKTLFSVLIMKIKMPGQLCCQEKIM